MQKSTQEHLAVNRADVPTAVSEDAPTTVAGVASTLPEPLSGKRAKKLAVVLALLAVACTDPDRAGEVLRAQGYTDIQITGYDAFACSKDDAYHTGFVAKSPAGVRVRGVVCAGLMFKGSTIRFD